MNDFELNSSWDIEQSSDNEGWVTIEGQDAIAQNIKQRLQTVVGEWFLNVTIYVDMFDTIFNKRTPPAIIESHLKKIISETPGFIAFDSFAIDLNVSTRVMSVDFVAKTVSGVVEYNGIIGGL